MSLPFVAQALRGWLSNQKVLTVKQSVDEFGTVMKTAEPSTKMMMIQPMAQEKLQETPQESRSTTWWTLYIQENKPSLEMDDIVIIDGKNYQIKSISDWSRSGYCEYSCAQYHGSPITEIDSVTT